MEIFVHIGNPHLDGIAADLEAAISAWVMDCRCTTARPIAECDADTGDRTLGLRIDTSKKAVLKHALDFLYGIARQYQQDCVVGYVDSRAGTAHEVCYFGHRQGWPDIEEVAGCLGLRH